MKKIATILMACLVFFSISYTIFRDAYTLAFTVYFAIFNLILLVHQVVLPEVRSALGRAKDNTGQ